MVENETMCTPNPDIGNYDKEDKAAIKAIEEASRIPGVYRRSLVFFTYDSEHPENSSVEAHITQQMILDKEKSTNSHGNNYNSNKISQLEDEITKECDPMAIGAFKKIGEAIFDLPTDEDLENKYKNRHRDTFTNAFHVKDDSVAKSYLKRDFMDMAQVLQFTGDNALARATKAADAFMKVRKAKPRWEPEKFPESQFTSEVDRFNTIYGLSPINNHPNKQLLRMIRDYLKEKDSLETKVEFAKLGLELLKLKPDNSNIHTSIETIAQCEKPSSKTKYFEILATIAKRHNLFDENDLNLLSNIKDYLKSNTPGDKAKESFAEFGLDILNRLSKNTEERGATAAGTAAGGENTALKAAENYMKENTGHKCGLFKPRKRAKIIENYRTECSTATPN